MSEPPNSPLGAPEASRRSKSRSSSASSESSDYEHALYGDEEEEPEDEDVEEEEDDAEEEEEEEEEEVDEEEVKKLNLSINKTSAKFNLSTGDAKDLIKTIVSNDHVLAIWKLRAEAIEKEKKNFTDQLTYESPEGVRLTRNKAKELNHSISTTIPSLNLSNIEPDEEVKQLITEELPEEEDDEEYNPNHDEDQYHSDDYSTTTCSDIESQPRTPADRGIIEVDDPLHESEVLYDKEGVFKVPGEPRTPNRQSQDETVSRRTRSKFSLQETPIESIQQTFVPPDLFAEVVDPDHEEEADPPWQEFLEQFQKPLENEDKEEEDNDPEYVASGRETDNSKITVSKREVQELFDELLEGFEESFNPDFANDLEIEAFKAALAAPSPQAEAGYANFTENLLPLAESSMKISNEQPIVSESVQLPQATLLQPLSAHNVVSTFPADVNMVLGTDDKLYLVPNAPQEEELPSEEIHNLPECEEEEVEEEDGTEICGWTKRSLKIFQQQLLSHVQLCGQFFVLTYSHPWFWKLARDFKDILEDLWKETEKESFPLLRELCWNLPDILWICNDWAEELNVENEENENYVKDLLPFRTRTKQILRFFHHRVAEKFLENKAFIFESLLPKRVPGCYVTQGRRRMTQGERLLFVLCLHETVEVPSSSKKRECHRTRATRLFRRKFGLSWSGHRLKMILSREGQLRAKENCFKAFLRRNELPEIKHETIKIGSYDEVKPLGERSLEGLHENWRKYVTSTERAERLDNPEEGKRFLEVDLEKRILYPPEPKASDEEEEEEDFELKVKDRKKRKRKKKTKGSKAERRETEKETRNLNNNNNISLEVVDQEVVQTKRLKTDERIPIREDEDLNLGRGEIEAIKRAIEKMRRKQNRSKSLEPLRRRKRLTLKLYFSLKKCNGDYDQNMKSLNDHSISTKIFHYLKEFDLFAEILGKKMEMMSQKEDVLSSINSISLKNPSTDDREMFAWTFILKVEREYKLPKERFMFKKFMDILEITKTIPELIVELEGLLLPEHPELVETFLNYLLPDHAQQVTKFFQRLINLNMKSLKRDLTTYLSNRKDQFAQIYDLLNELGASEEKFTMSEIKKRFSEILSGNPLLSSWFFQLFPNQSTESEGSETENESSCDVDTYQTSHSSEVKLDHQDNENTIVNDEISKTKSESHNPWTREEDMAIFQHVNGVNDCPEEEVLDRLSQTIPTRSPKEIQDRFRVIVSLFNKMSQ